MRLRTLNRLAQVSSAAVAALLVSSGCHLHKAPPPTPALEKPSLGEASTMPAATEQSTTLNTTEPMAAMPATLPTTESATSPSTLPTTDASTLPVTQPTTEAGAPALPVPIPVPVPAVLPASAPASMPATVPATAPEMTPATEPATVPATEAVPATAPATQPATAPATQAAAPPVVEPPAPPIADEAPPTDPDQIQADQTLAEQLDSIAELQFSGKKSSDDAWPLLLRHEAALLSACVSLNPTTERFPRLIADTMSQLQDRNGELAALLKAITVNPEDEFSWNRRLELILAPMQTARQKIDYLRDVISRSTGDVIVPPDVRAHAAFRCAQLLLERGEDDAAKTVLADALRECPSDVECLTLRYQMLPSDTPRFERSEQLLDLLRANPLQSQYSTLLADMIADSGLTQECLPWYQLAVSTLHLQGDPARHSMLNWAAELYIGDETLDALKLNQALLQIDPKYTPAYFLELVMVRSTGDKDSLTKALQEATNALSNRVVDAVNAAAPPDATKASTRPISDETPLELPDLSPTVDLIKKGVSPEIKQQFIEAVADMALLEGYFAEDSLTASKLLDALGAVLPADAPELARLRGWNDLLANKPDDAKAKFTTVAAQDPLAELGLVKIMLDSQTDRPTAESMGRRLLQDHPSGLLGAMLWERLHGERVKLITTTQADALREAVIQFPSALLEMVNRPQNLYAVRVMPQPVGSQLGEPLMAQVSIRNISDYDLTIGSDGVLKPDLFFKLMPKLDKTPRFAAYDTVAGPTILASHTSIDQMVRLDQTQLLEYLNTQNAMQFEVSGMLDTNETLRGLGGYGVQFLRGFFRTSSNLTPEHEQAALAAVSKGRPDQKITALSLLEHYVEELEKTRDPDMAVRQHAVALIGEIHRARLDPIQAVSAWAGQCECLVSNESDRENVVRDLEEDADWRHRQMALLVAPNLPQDLRDQVLGKLSIDTQSSVRSEAIALKALAAMPPAPDASATPVPPAATPDATPPAMPAQ